MEQSFKTFNNMAYTETRTTSYGSRLGGSLRGIPIGIILFLVATVLLWLNEGRAVHRSQDIKQVAKTAQSVGDISSVTTALDGQLIHTTGMATAIDTLADATFGVRANTMAMVRAVEYYQWKENRHKTSEDKLGGKEEETTHYTYERGWSNVAINSDEFKDPDYKGINSVIMNVERQYTVAKNVSFGNYRLPESFVQKLAIEISGQMQPLQVPANSQALIDLNASLMKSLGQNVRPEAAQVKDSLAYVHVMGNQLYIGLNPSNPAIGDLRITFQALPSSSNVSLIAVPQGNTFTTFKAKNDESEYELSAGIRSLDEMIQSAHQSNKTLTWFLRILGLLVVCFALRKMFSILVMLFKVVPFLANIISLGVNLVCNVLGFAWSLIVIAIAWIFYRPLLGISLLVIAAALIFFLSIKGKKPAETVA